MSIVGILLAAGRGARFGGGKLLAPIPAASHGVGGGTPVGAAAAIHLMAALNDVVAVVRPGDSMLERVLADTGARVVECARADEGMGASLACGVARRARRGRLDRRARRHAVDRAGTDRRRRGCVARAAPRSPRRASAASAVIRWGSRAPTGRCWSALTGDEGARAIVAARQWALALVDVDDAGVVRDVDRPADLDSAPPPSGR